MKLRYTGRAVQDLELAFVWYERQRHGLGFEFLDCVEFTIKSILDNPKKFRIYYAQFRAGVGKKIAAHDFCEWLYKY